MKNFLKKCFAIPVLIIIFTISCLPRPAVYADVSVNGRKQYHGDIVGIASTSVELLKIIKTQMKYDKFYEYTNYLYYDSAPPGSGKPNELAILSIGRGESTMKVPKNYFNIYSESYKGKLIVPNWSDVVHPECIVDEFDFSNIDLGDISVLPNFSMWYKTGSSFLKLKFNGCNITDLSPFKNNIDKLKYTDIDLSGNTVREEDWIDFENKIYGKGITISENGKPNIIPSEKKKTDNTKSQVSNSNNSTQKKQQQNNRKEDNRKEDNKKEDNRKEDNKKEDNRKEDNRQKDNRQKDNRQKQHKQDHSRSTKNRKAITKSK